MGTAGRLRGGETGSITPSLGRHHVTISGAAPPQGLDNRIGISAPETSRRPRGRRSDIVTGWERLYGHVGGRAAMSGSMNPFLPHRVKNLLTPIAALR